MNRFLTMILITTLVSCAIPEVSKRRAPPSNISAYGLDQTVHMRAAFAQEGAAAKDGFEPMPGEPVPNYLPMNRVAPYYPLGARNRGKTGWVLLVYTITENGGIEDIRILDEYPESTFSKSALEAAPQFKFRPYTENGVATRIPNAWNIFTYDISY